MQRTTRSGGAVLGVIALLGACREASIPDPALAGLPTRGAPMAVSAGNAVILADAASGEGYGDARAVNRFGAVAGSADDTVTTSHAARWAADGSPSRLDTFTPNHWAYNGRGYSYGFGMNDDGAVVGYSFRNGEYSIEATLWQGGTQTRLGHPEGFTSMAFDINNAGQIVGRAANYAALWTGGGGPTPLGTLPGWDGSQANAINDLGWVAGSYRPLAGGDAAVIWSPDGTAHDLGTGPGSIAYAINDLGQVAGYRKVEGSIRAFVWTQEGGFQDLGPGRAYGINNAGVVVGSMGGYGAAYWTSESGVVPLNGPDGLPANGEAYAIGDDGTVAGAILGRPARWRLTGASPVPPAAPSSPQRAVSPGLAVRVTWTDMSGNEIHFSLTRRVQNHDGSWSGFSPVAEPGANVTTHLDSGLVNGKTYQYRLRACNTAGCSAYVFTSPVLVGPLPAAPGGVTGTVPSANRIQVRWNDLSADETRFEVSRRRRNLDGAWQGYGTIALPAAGTTALLDSAVYTAYGYQYRVRACNAIGCSAWAEGPVVSIPLAPGTAAVDPPASASSLTLRWGDRSTDENGFQIGRRTQAAGGSWGAYVNLKTVGANLVAYTDGTTAGGTTYQYRVRACNASGCSAWRIAPAATTP